MYATHPKIRRYASGGRSATYAGAGRRSASAALLFVLFCVSCAHRPAPDIRIESAWTRPVAVAPSATRPARASGSNGVVYLTIINRGDAPDRLLAGHSEICRAVEIHETQVTNGRMRMRKVSNGVEIPARGKVVLQPGGLHLMLLNMRRPLAAGDRFEVALRFEKSGWDTLTSVVKFE